MTARDWIENARSLTQSSSIPLGAPVATHIDMLLRDTRRDLHAALDALEAVLVGHAPRDHRPLDGTYLGGKVCDACRRPWPCSTVTAIESVLLGES